MPEQDADASEVHEAEEVLGMALVAGHESPVVLKPGEEPLDPPTTPHATKRTTILSLRALAVAAVPGDQLDSSLLHQALIQSVAVVCPVTDQALGGGREEPVVDRLLYEGDLMGEARAIPMATGRPERSAMAMILVPFPRFVFPTQEPPFFAPAKVASMKHSVRSMPPRS